MKNLLIKFSNIFKTKQAESLPDEEIDDEDDFADVVDNNIGILRNRDKECIDLDEMIYYSSDIELNRHNNNTFVMKFYPLLFDAELYNIKLIIVAKLDEIDEQKHEYDRAEAEGIHKKAKEIFEREMQNFMLYASENFQAESITMIKSMKAKKIVAVALEDIDLYFQTEWQSRKTKSYPAILAKLKLVETVIMEEYKKLKIVPDTPPPDEFLNDMGGTESKGNATISFN